MIRHDYEQIYYRLCASHPSLSEDFDAWVDFYPEEREEKYYNFIWDKYLDGTLEAEEIWPDEPIMRLITLCSGYDSQGLAFKAEDIPFELSAWSEFDPESKTPLDKQPAVVAHNLLFPRWADRNLGDMTKIDWDAWRSEHSEDIDLLTYSTPCFVAGTLVTTELGDKPIEKIKVGDSVLTSNGYKKVIHTFDNGLRDILLLTIYCFGEKYFVMNFGVTPNHKFKTTNGWKEAINLSTNDELYVLASDGEVYVSKITRLLWKGDKQRVFDIEVEEMHEFFANHTLVHNCQSISSAGLQHGISKDSGTRSSILWYTEYAIKSLQPKYLLQENVSALVSKKFMSDFLQWQELVASYGYKNYLPPQFITPDGEKTKQYCMNSKNYGIPQSRERVFLLSVRNDLCRKSYSFPAPIRLEKKLKDVLLKEVPEKYYLNQTKVDEFVEKNKEQIDKNTSNV